MRGPTRRNCTLLKTAPSAVAMKKHVLIVEKSDSHHDRSAGLHRSVFLQVNRREVR